MRFSSSDIPRRLLMAAAVRRAGTSALPGVGRSGGALVRVRADDVAGGAHAACAPAPVVAMFGLSGAELAAAEADAARSLAAADRFLEAAERQLRAPRAFPPLAPGGA